MARWQPPADFSGTFKLTLTDITGRKIREHHVYTPNDAWRLDISNIVSGTYFVTLEGLNKHLTEKLVITK